MIIVTVISSINVYKLVQNLCKHFGYQLYRLGNKWIKLLFCLKNLTVFKSRVDNIAISYFFTTRRISWLRTVYYNSVCCLLLTSAESTQSFPYLFSCLRISKQRWLNQSLTTSFGLLLLATVPLANLHCSNILQMASLQRWDGVTYLEKMNDS